MLCNHKHQLSNLLTAPWQTVSNVAYVAIQARSEVDRSHRGHNAAFVARNYVRRGLAGRWEDYCSSDSDSCLSSTLQSFALPPTPSRGAARDIGQRGPIQEERAAEEKEGGKEEREGGEACQNKETEEACKFVNLICFWFFSPDHITPSFVIYLFIWYHPLLSFPPGKRCRQRFGQREGLWRELGQHRQRLWLRREEEKEET